MTESIVAFMLVISSWQSSKNMANQLGPYSDLASCHVVQLSTPLRDFSTQCVKVKIPVRQ